MRLAELLSPAMERNPPKDSVVFSVSERLGVVPQEQLFTKKIALDDKRKYLRVRPGDVVYNSYLLWNGAVGVCFDDRGGCTSPAYVVLRPRYRGIERFLHYFLRSATFTSTVDAIASGSVTRRRTAPVKDILNLEFPLPQLSDQRRANLLLRDIDDKIELNRRMNETLETITRAIFKSWFVDFDPVRAKASGEPPESICRRLGLTPDLLALFPFRLVDSELGEIPEGWGVATLGDVAEHPRRGIKPNQINEKTPYIALEHMPRRCIALPEWGIADGIESNKFEFKKGEILFGKLRPYFHKVGVAPVDGVCSTDIVVIAPKLEEWFGFVLGHVSSDAFVEHTNAGSTGTKMPRTSWADMSRYSIVTPTKKLAEAFTDLVQATIERINAAIHESRTLGTVRDTLLPKLLSGELRVPMEEDEAEVIA